MNNTRAALARTKLVSAALIASMLVPPRLDEVKKHTKSKKGTIPVLPAELSLLYLVAFLVKMIQPMPSRSLRVSARSFWQTVWAKSTNV
jgi:hypothetical protein